MAEDTHYNQLEVDIKDLKEDMLITAYTGFNKKYDQLDEKTCKWLKHNFKGAGSIIYRGGEKQSISIDQIKEGDGLHKIHKIPISLVNITKVSSKLVKELEYRGFSKFAVQQAIVDESEEQESMEQAIEQANTFVQKVKESVGVCKDASKAVEYLMDNTRHSKPDIANIKKYVGELTENESADAISAIISLKENDQVYAHCLDVGVLFQIVYFEMIKMRGEQSIFKDEKEAMLAAFLHDIGKAKIPKDILSSTRSFKRDSKEMELIREHSVAGAKLLSSIGMPDYIVNMAHYHHVKLDNTMASSYPKDVPDTDIIFETRLLTLIDAYQALTAGRSYKKSWTPPAVMRYLDATAGVEFDLQMWQDFQKVMGHYPKGSFVKLSDGSYGFVMNVPSEDVLNPQVAVIKDADGSDLQNHYLVDLQKESDLSIAQDIDVRSIYQENALDIFINIKVS